MRSRVSVAVILLTAFAILPGIVAGCKGAPVQTVDAQKTDALIKGSGGDWNRLAPPDRAALVRDLGKGNEQTAYLNFQARWNRLKKGGGPPNPAAMARQAHGPSQ
jgi:hypothetical protein